MGATARVLGRSATLVRQAQLRAFSDGGKPLHEFPNLFVFVAQYALQSIVAHFVEGRHRQISLHASGAAGHTVPGGQSALMRRPEAEANLDSPNFMAWLCSIWRSKSALMDLLLPVCGQSELVGLSYYKRVQKIYGADVDSQFRPIPEITGAVTAWSKPARSGKSQWRSSRPPRSSCASAT